MRRSRLKSHAEKQTKSSFIKTLVILVVIGIFLVLFGIPLLINFSLLLEKSFDKKTAAISEIDYVTPPLLDPLPKATSSQDITVTGSAGSGQDVRIFVNGKFADKTSIKGDGTFGFSGVRLSEGENTIQAKVVTEEKNESRFSDSITIHFLKEPPALSIDSPSDGEKISGIDNTILVSGKTDKSAKVTVNGFWAIMDDEGNYHYRLPLSNSENTIKVIATDPAGNKTEKEIKVTYSP